MNLSPRMTFLFQQGSSASLELRLVDFGRCLSIHGPWIRSGAVGGSNNADVPR